MNDTIYRQAAIDCLCNGKCTEEGRWCDDGDCMPVRRINSLPSAQPERKRGKWLLYAQRDGIETGSECSQCGYHIYIPPQYGHNFCPNCGATMEKG